MGAFKTNEPTRKCVVLSGGQDSTTCLFHQKAKGHDLVAVSYNYGQRHKVEIEAAKIIARIAGIKHEVIDIPDVLRGGTLLGGKLHTYRDFHEMVRKVGNKVEATYVPVRNMIFLALACNYAITEGIDWLVTGICGSDTANYPDCTKAFTVRAQAALSCGLGKAFHIDAPLIDMPKAKICTLAWKLGAQCWDALSYSHTAYSGKWPPTERDHSTLLRAKGFEEAGLPDPMIVRAHKELNFKLPKTKNYSRQLVDDTMAILSDRSDYAE